MAVHDDPPQIVVAFRTHVWTDYVASVAHDLRDACDGLRFVVVADQSAGEYDCPGFETVAHTNDMSGFGLPQTPAHRTLWFNADYPLYFLREWFPETEFFVMLENDVVASADLGEIFRDAHRSGIDLLATHVEEAPPNWSWRKTTARLEEPVRRAWVQVLGVSARGVDALLAGRRALVEHDDGTEANWPYCEAFIPSTLSPANGYSVRDLRAYHQDVDFAYFSALSTHAYEDPRIHGPNGIAHPVLPAAVAGSKRVTNEQEIWTVLDRESNLSRALEHCDPRDFWAALYARFGRVVRDPDASHRLGLEAVYRRWVESPPPVNWALGRPATQSSLQARRQDTRSLGDDARRATNGILQDGSGFHTGHDPQPWWQVDLERTVDVDRVAIWHRSRNRNRARHLELETSVDGRTWNRVALIEGPHLFGNAPKPEPLEVVVNRSVARFVRVTSCVAGVLHLDQVEVFGTPVERAR